MSGKSVDELLNCRMRVGRKLGRTLYLIPPGTEDDWEAHVFAGIVETRELAEGLCAVWNDAE